MAVTASEARKNLFPLIEKVNDDRTPIEITSRRGDAVLLSRADYDALEETAHLLRVPANAKRLIESLQQVRGFLQGVVVGTGQEDGVSPPRRDLDRGAIVVDLFDQLEEVLACLARSDRHR